MIKRFRMMALLLSIVGISSGCATIVSGTSQTVSINSDPADATVTINGTMVGTTPWAGSVKKAKSTIALVQKKGYSAQTLSLTSSFNPVFLGNILFGGLLGSTTDFATGAMWEYAPNSYYVSLREVSQSRSEFIREAELKAFAMTYFGPLQAELAAGEGPKLRVLHAHYGGDRGYSLFLDQARMLPRTGAVEFAESLAQILATGT